MAIPMLPIRDPQEPAEIRRSAYRNSRSLNLKLRRLADELEKAWHGSANDGSFMLTAAEKETNRMDSQICFVIALDSVKPCMEARA